MNKGKPEIREFLKCNARPIKLDVSPGAFPAGMFPKQEAINPEGRHIIFIGMCGEIPWYVFMDEDGLWKWDRYTKTKTSFIRAGFQFLN